MPAAPLRIGIMGTARIARSFAQGVAPSQRVRIAAVASRNPAKAQEFAGALGIAKCLGSYEALLADTGIEADIPRIFDTAEELFGPVTGLVNNAGMNGGPAALMDIEVAEIRRLLEVNVLGVAHAIDADRTSPRAICRASWLASRAVSRATNTSALSRCRVSAT